MGFSVVFFSYSPSNWADNCTRKQYGSTQKTLLAAITKPCIHLEIKVIASLSVMGWHYHFKKKMSCLGLTSNLLQPSHYNVLWFCATQERYIQLNKSALWCQWWLLMANVRRASILINKSLSIHVKRDPPRGVRSANHCPDTSRTSGKG